MADIKDLTPDLDRLEGQLDNLEEALTPLTDGLDERASRLPLLDRAKLFSLSAYAIESLLFSSLRLHGEDAKQHAVFTELKRVQQYFAKIQAAEEGEEAKKKGRTLTVNQEAAARVLKANLSDNKSVSSKLAEKIAEERAKALLKAVEGKSGSGSGSGSGNSSGNNKRPAEESAATTTTEEKKKRSRKSREKRRGD